MSYLLRFKHWQLFAIFIVLPFISDVFMLFALVINLAWMYTIGTVMNAKIPANYRPDMLLYRGCCALLFAIGIASVVLRANATAFPYGNYHYLSWAVFAIYILTYLYVVHFTTKMLMQAIGGGDFWLCFFRFMVCFIGVWSIQPMVQQLYSEESEVRDALG